VGRYRKAVKETEYSEGDHVNREENRKKRKTDGKTVAWLRSAPFFHRAFDVRARAWDGGPVVWNAAKMVAAHSGLSSPVL
jgi:hypothetical protein